MAEGGGSLPFYENVSESQKRLLQQQSSAAGRGSGYIPRAGPEGAPSSQGRVLSLATGGPGASGIAHNRASARVFTLPPENSYVNDGGEPPTVAQEPLYKVVGKKKKTPKGGASHPAAAGYNLLHVLFTFSSRSLHVLFTFSTFLILSHPGRRSKCPLFEAQKAIK